jgi:hypothetical protein
MEDPIDSINRLLREDRERKRNQYRNRRAEMKLIEEAILLRSIVKPKVKEIVEEPYTLNQIPSEQVFKPKEEEIIQPQPIKETEKEEISEEAEKPLKNQRVIK